PGAFCWLRDGFRRRLCKTLGSSFPRLRGRSLRCGGSLQRRNRSLLVSDLGLGLVRRLAFSLFLGEAELAQPRGLLAFGLLSGDVFRHRNFAFASLLLASLGGQSRALLLAGRFGWRWRFGQG